MPMDGCSKAARAQEWPVISGIFIMPMSKYADPSYARSRVSRYQSTLFPCTYKVLQRQFDKVLQIGTRFHSRLDSRLPSGRKEMQCIGLNPGLISLIAPYSVGFQRGLI